MRITKYTTLLDHEKHCSLIKEKAFNYPEETLNNPKAIYTMLCDVFKHNRQTEEYVYLLCFNAKYRLLGIFELSHGSVGISICSPREIMQKALLCNASNFIVAHNHPSGDTTPSGSDISVYRKILEASKIVDISFADNLIIGDGYYSFREHEIEE